MSWYDNVFELIDMRSFSNLWFWIVLAVMWSSASHWVLGVPFDMVVRARRQGGQVAEDLAALVRIQSRRRLYIMDVAGLWLVGMGMAVLTTLALLGFWYRLEFAQALFLLAMPMSVVGLMSQAAARRIEAQQLEGQALCASLARLRFWIQVVGVISVFVTALWGMWQNMNLGVLGR